MQISFIHHRSYAKKKNKNFNFLSFLILNKFSIFLDFDFMFIHIYFIFDWFALLRVRLQHSAIIFFLLHARQKL